MRSRPWESASISRMNSAFRRKRKRQWLLPCSRMKRGIGGRAMYRRLRERSGRRYSERFPMHEAAEMHAKNTSFASLRTTTLCRVTILLPTRDLLLFLGPCLLPLTPCSQAPDPNTLVMIIYTTPTNLDPLVGIDAWSERIVAMTFDDLLDPDQHLHVT